MSPTPAGSAARERPTPAPSPQRRRGDALIRAILDATWAELEAVGYRDLTIEAVAERAQASKASIYRRWAGKPQLVYAATRQRFPDEDQVPDTGSLRGDLIAVLTSSAQVLRGPGGAAIRGLLSHSLQSGTPMSALRPASGSRSAAVMSAVLDRARARGDVSSAEVDPLRLEAGQALLRFRFLFGQEPVDDVLITRIVDEVMLPLLDGR